MLASRRAKVVEQDLEQWRRSRLAHGVQLLDELREWIILVFQRIVHSARHSLYPLDKTLRGIDLLADHDGIGEKACGAREVRPCAAGGDRADDEIRLPRVTIQ